MKKSKEKPKLTKVAVMRHLNNYVQSLYKVTIEPTKQS